MAKEHTYTDDQIIFECYGVFRIKYDPDNEDDVVIGYDYIKSFHKLENAKQFAESESRMDDDEVFEWRSGRETVGLEVYVMKFIGHDDEDEGFIPADEPCDEMVVKKLRVIDYI